MLGACVGLALKNEVQLPVPPFGRSQLSFDIKQKAFAGGFFGFAHPPIELVDAIDRAIRWNHCTSGQRQSGEQIGHMHDLIALAACLHLARPAHDERHTQAAFHRGVVGARPRASSAAPRAAKLGAVVAGEDEERVVSNT